MNLQRTSIAFFLLLCIFYDGCSAEGEIPCPENCTCPADGELICKNIDYIPMFDGRHLIHTMSILNHSISSIKQGDFINFTKLSMLTLTGGRIYKLTNESFVEIKSTIARMELSSNHIKFIESGTFVGFTSLTDLELNFNDLSKLETGSFSNLPSLVTLKFEYNHIGLVEPNAFVNVSQLDSLNMFGNQLTEIPWAGIKSLNGLKQLDLRKNRITRVGEDTTVFLENLEDLILDSNPISQIHTFPNVSSSLKILNLGFSKLDSFAANTWMNVPKLEELYLDGIQVLEITAGMFVGLGELRRLYLTDQDHLTKVDAHAFVGLFSIEVIDLSRNKKLTTIHEDAFTDTHVSKVYLHDCGLPMFPETMLNWTSMKYVSISPNPINCDCHVQWMTNASVFGNSTDISSLKCYLPSQFAGQRVISMDPTTLKCNHDDHSKRVLTGALVAIVVFTFMTAFALIFKFRHRIMSAGRRYFQYRRYRNDMIFTVENDTSIGELDDAEARPLKDMRLETVPLEDSA